MQAVEHVPAVLGRAIGPAHALGIALAAATTKSTEIVAHATDRHIARLITTEIAATIACPAADFIPLVALPISLEGVDEGPSAELVAQIESALVETLRDRRSKQQNLSLIHISEPTRRS